MNDRTKHEHLKPPSGSNYIKLPKELNHSRKRFVNFQNNDDNEYFKWCLVRYLNPSGHHLVGIRKNDKDLARKLGFKETKFPVTILDIYNFQRKKLYQNQHFSL